MTVMTEAKPEVEYDKGAIEAEHGYVYDAFRHEDGSLTYIVADDDSEHLNPRKNDDCNVATLINENDRNIDMDTDVAKLSEARDRFDPYGRRGTSARGYGHGKNVRADREAMMKRYIAIFRPDILHYVDRWDYGREGYGWGYVTRDLWREHMFPTLADDATDEQKQAWLDYEPGTTPEEQFDNELRLYSQWAEGEVYGAIHVTVGEPIVVYGEHGAYVDGYETEEETCGGFLGYDDRELIADQMTDSPVTEALY